MVTRHATYSKRKIMKIPQRKIENLPLIPYLLFHFSEVINVNVFQFYMIFPTCCFLPKKSYTLLYTFEIYFYFNQIETHCKQYSEPTFDLRPLSLKKKNMIIHKLTHMQVVYKENYVRCWGILEQYLVFSIFSWVSLQLSFFSFLWLHHSPTFIWLIVTHVNNLGNLHINVINCI